MADKDIEEESMMASPRDTEKGPGEKVVYGGARRRGPENSLVFRRVRKERLEGRQKGRYEERKQIGLGFVVRGGRREKSCRPKWLRKEQGDGRREEE
jgi:hypothetical protein